MLRQARAKGLPCVQADACRLPFADQRFDRVLAVDAFHHFAWPTAAEAQPLAAEQMLRVLAPRGRVVIGEPDIRVTGVKVIALVEKLLLMRSRILARFRLSTPPAVRLLATITSAYKLVSAAAESSLVPGPRIAPPGAAGPPTAVVPAEVVRSRCAGPAVQSLRRTPDQRDSARPARSTRPTASRRPDGVPDHLNGRGNRRQIVDVPVQRLPRPEMPAHAGAETPGAACAAHVDVDAGREFA
jgi:hypothetical protein